MIIQLILSTIAVFVAAYVIPGVTVSGWVAALSVAVVLGVYKIFLRPIILFLTLPVTVVTLGLFAFVVNTCIIMLVAYIVPGFHVDSFWSALAFSIFFSLFQAFFSLFS